MTIRNPTDNFSATAGGSGTGHVNAMLLKSQARCAHMTRQNHRITRHTHLEGRP